MIGSYALQEWQVLFSNPSQEPIDLTQKFLWFLHLRRVAALIYDNQFGVCESLIVEFSAFQRDDRGLSAPQYQGWRVY